MPSKNLPNRKKREQVRRGNPKELPIGTFLRAKRRRKQQNKLQETLIRSVARQDTLQHEKMDIIAFQKQSLQRQIAMDIFWLVELKFCHFLIKYERRDMVRCRFQVSFQPSKIIRTTKHGTEPISGEFLALQNQARTTRNGTEPISVDHFQ
jgi:hypothetical protein